MLRDLHVSGHMTALAIYGMMITDAFLIALVAIFVVGPVGNDKI
jgi:hypothetical protein